MLQESECLCFLCSGGLVMGNPTGMVIQELLGGETGGKRNHFNWTKTEDLKLRMV